VEQLEACPNREMMHCVLKTLPVAELSVSCLKRTALTDRVQQCFQQFTVGDFQKLLHWMQYAIPPISDLAPPFRPDQICRIKAYASPLVFLFSAVNQSLNKKGLRVEFGNDPAYQAVQIAISGLYANNLICH
jgi:hypothetical protein